MSQNPDTESLVGQPLDLSNLVEYQSGSVVSRAVVKQEKGNVTLFAFDTGQELSEHTAPFDAMVCVLDGEARITIEGNAHTVAAGQMIIMPADKPHAVKAQQRFKMMLVMIRA
jgi:quercetin dioxygenase-like cupin family protein